MTENQNSPAPQEPTTHVPSPQGPTHLPRWAKRAAVTAAAVIAASSLVGAGMAIASPTRNSSMDMQSGTTGAHSGSKHHAAGKHAPDPARVAWAHKYGQDRTTMSLLAPVDQATAAQQAAAQQLLTQTEADTAKYADLTIAKQAGYDISAALARAEKKHPKLAAKLLQIDNGAKPATNAMLHVANKALAHDGKVLDPTAPETLMYQYEGHNNWKLIGVMYTAKESFPQAPPDPGGPITRWHYHPQAGGASLMMHIFFVNDLAHAYATQMK